MKNFVVEKDFEIDGFRCIVVGMALGHRCGYVGVPEGHELYGKDYDYVNLDCHGGLTFAGAKDEYPGLWFLGFDCAHYGDGRDEKLVKMDPTYYAQWLLSRAMFPYGGEVRTTEYVENELKNLVRQIKNKEYDEYENS